MEKSIELEPSALEMIIARALLHLEATCIFTPEGIQSLRDAAVEGSLSKTKDIQAILERDLEEVLK